MSLYAALDLGANSIRMSIAQKINNELKIIDKMEYPLRLGKETFLKRHLSSEALHETIKVLQAFKQKMDEYQIDRYKAVATSAIREIDNQDFFIEQIRLKVGLLIEVIEKSEEEKLVYMGLMEKIPDFKKLLIKGVMFTKVGSGNVEISIIKLNDVFFSRSIPIGGLRLRQALSEISEEKFCEAMENYIHSDIKMLEQSLPDFDVKYVIGGGTLLRIIYNIIKPKTNKITKESILKLYKILKTKSIWQICEKYNLPLEHGDLLLPSTYIYLRFLELVKVNSIIFSDISFTECILNNLAGVYKSQIISKQIWKSAISIGEKYHFDRKHALQVSKIAVKIFDDLKELHNLSIKHRFILKLASLWHDIGIFIKNSEHHKHSYYIISNIEMLGISSSDIKLIATIARYHRRSMPKKYHTEYITLKDRERVVVSKLAAILRIADALDRSHTQSLESLKTEILENEIVINAKFKKSSLLEKIHFQSKKNLFQRVFGINIELVENNL